MSAKVIARYIILILALVNQYLTTKNINPIPVMSEEDISSIVMIVASLFMADKNNSRTKEARKADRDLEKYRAEKKLVKSTGRAPLG